MMRGKEKQPKNWGPSLTKQEPAADADVNQMVRRFFKTGYMPQTNRQPRFGDFTGPGFQEMNNAISAAHSQFMGLPAPVRKRFKNNPQNLINWLDDPENGKEAIKLGLIPEPPPEAPTAEELEKAKTVRIDEIRQALKADPESQPGFRKARTPQGD